MLRPSDGEASIASAPVHRLCNIHGTPFLTAVRPLRRLLDSSKPSPLCCWPGLVCKQSASGADSPAHFIQPARNSLRPAARSARVTVAKCPKIERKCFMQLPWLAALFVSQPGLC